MCGLYCLSGLNYPLAGLCQDLVSKFFWFLGGLSLHLNHLIA